MNDLGKFEQKFKGKLKEKIREYLGYLNKFWKKSNFKGIDILWNVR